MRACERQLSHSQEFWEGADTTLAAGRSAMVSVFTPGTWADATDQAPPAPAPTRLLTDYHSTCILSKAVGQGTRLQKTKMYHFSIFARLKKKKMGPFIQ